MSREIEESIRGQDPVRRLQAFLDERLAGRQGLEVLEAGCGSASYFRFGETPRLTGIDIAPEPLEANRALAVRVVGNLETHDFGAARFDVVVSWNVFEHLEHPERALDLLARALRPGGLLVLGLPNVDSVKGLATKHLPHAAHVWVYRTIHRNPRAGTGANGPFRTFLKPAVARPALIARAATLGLALAWSDSYDFSDVVRLSGIRRLFGLGYDAVRGVAAVASAGRLGTSELILVFEKPPARGPAALPDSPSG